MKMIFSTKSKFHLYMLRFHRESLTLRRDYGEGFIEIKFHIVYFLEIPSTFEGLQLYQASPADRDVIKNRIQEPSLSDKVSCWILYSKGEKFFVVSEYLVIEESENGTQHII